MTNTILGGSFTSRLNHNLRETKGYTYGASSQFDFRLSTGPFVAEAAVQTDKTGAALTEFFKELEGIRSQVPAEELARAKNYTARRFPAAFETAGQLAGRIRDQFVYGLPEDYFDTYVARIEAVTAADVQRVARSWIDPAAMVVVIVGDRKKIEPEVRALHLGPVEVRSIDDVLGRPPGGTLGGDGDTIPPETRRRGPARARARPPRRKTRRPRRHQKQGVRNLALAIFFFILGRDRGAPARSCRRSPSSS